MSNELILEKINASTVVRFGRPELMNPLSISVLEALHVVLDDSAADPETDRLIFTGEKNVFASGADLREIAAVTPDGAREFARRGQTLMAKVAAHPRSIAAVNGYCFGGALDLALACRFRIASQDALFSHPGSGLGIMTGWGGTQRLPRLIGEAATLEMLFTGRRVTAVEALKLGLIDQISDDPLAAALQYSGQ